MVEKLLVFQRASFCALAAAIRTCRKRSPKSVSRTRAGSVLLADPQTNGGACRRRGKRSFCIEGHVPGMPGRYFPLDLVLQSIPCVLPTESFHGFPSASL